MNCRYCGKKLPDGYEDIRCPFCYAEVETDLPYTAMNQEEESKKKRGEK